MAAPNPRPVPFPRARVLSVACLLAACSAALPAGAAAGRHEPEKRGGARPATAAPDYDAPLPRWREGPVRYLLSKEEDDTYRALATEEARAAFIQKFWASRDPVPATAENEYRGLFLRRVSEVDRQFRESTKPGWKTDRGKIYILLGPPDDLDQAAAPRFGSRDILLWTYRNAPQGTGSGTNSTIRFVRDVTGEYRLSNSVFLSGLETSLGVGFQIQAMQMKSLPEPREVLDSVVSARALLGAAPFRTHGDFFRTGDGSTLAVLTLGVRRGFAREPEPDAEGVTEGAARFEVLARLAGEDPGLPTYDMPGPGALRPGDEDPSGPPGDYLLYQGGLAVKPGRYGVFYAIVDRATRQLYSFKDTIAVPDFRDAGLSLSSITLASRLERVAGAGGPGYSAPFVIGNLKVTPRPDDAFHTGEDLAFYYQIYGPSTDPIDGHPDLEVEYRFFVAGAVDARGEPDFTPLGQAIHLTRQQSPIQGYSLALKDWRPALYRLRVQVTDNLDGRQSSRDVTFRVF
jgi:GWxTD domain-containing protein